MPASRDFLKIVPVILLIVGAIVWGFTLLAPSIGLGEKEQFLFYQLFGWPRRQVFAGGSVLLSSGIAIFVIGNLVKSWPRISAKARAWIELVAEKVSAKQPARTRGTRTVSERIVRRLREIAGRLLETVSRLLNIVRWILVSRWSYGFLTIVAVITYSMLEYQVRVSTYEDYINDPMYHTMVFYSETMNAGGLDKLLGSEGKNSEIGIFKENRDITLAYLGFRGEVAKRVDFHLNNVGLISSRDIEIERTGPEFRIVVLGNEQTAPTTATRPWPEIMHDLLNKDHEFIRKIGGRKINVINYGWPDAGFPHYPSLWERAKAFKPDMVLMNIADHDFRRVWKLDTVIKKQKGTPSPRTYVSGFYDIAPAAGIDRPFIITMRCLNEPITLLNPNCTTSRPYGVFSPASLLDDKPALVAAHKKLIEEYAGGVIWNSIYPLALRAAFGYSMDPERLRKMDWPDSIQGAQGKLELPTDENEMVDLAIKFLKEITDDIPHILISRNAWYSELVPELSDFRMTRMLMKKKPDLEIRIMADYLPLDRGAKEIKSWYYVPKDPVKWTKKGHHVYARAMAKVVKEYVEKRGL